LLFTSDVPALVNDGWIRKIEKKIPLKEHYKKRGEAKGKYD
jgi:hypothetical protein